MYEAYFKLNENPFGTTPDPRFLYKGKAHREALAYLAYGVFRKKGFLALTGEVGIGKTTIVRAFIQTFHPCLEVAFILNTRVTFNELLYMLLTDLGVEPKTDSKVVMLSTLNQYLIDRYADNQNPLLIIDEAQNLTPEVLEELRMLSNLETDEQKLLQIVLVGQPELNNILVRDDMRQLRQRIPGVFHMKFLSREEVYSYIRYRLGVAGLANGQLIFSDNAVDAIHQFSSGIPRLINVLCDRVLLRGYLQKTHVVEKDLVEASILELSYHSGGGSGERRQPL
ncbi:MAG: AAA family ATPase [Candidatus Latescibacterota bacterium]|jgi:general secretion pathway protein A